jgi:hypothetical protein
MLTGQVVVTETKIVGRREVPETKTVLTEIQEPNVENKSIEYTIR